MNMSANKERTISQETRSPSIIRNTADCLWRGNQIPDEPARITEIIGKPQDTTEAIHTEIRAKSKEISLQHHEYAWKRIPEWDPYGVWTRYSVSHGKTKDLRPEHESNNKIPEKDIEKSESVTRNHVYKKE